MNFKSIKNKNIVDGKVVMTEPIVLFFEQVDVIVEHTVSEREAGRPDLISLKYYNVHSLTDLILKFNGISNPFAMNENDVIEIPVNQEKFKAFVKPNRSSGETQKEKFLKQRRLTEKDKKRFEFIQKTAQLEALPPNMLKTNQINKDVNLGIITDLNPSQS